MRTHWLAASTAAVALLATACGGTTHKEGSTGSGAAASAAPSDGLSGALTSYGKDANGTVTIKVFGAAADFDALSTTPTGSPASGSASTGSAKSKKNLAIADKLIPKSSVTITFERGSAPGSAKSEISVNLPNAPKAFDLISDHHILYVKADVKAFGAATGADMSKFNAQASAAAAQLPFLNPLLAGKYVSLDLKSLGALAQGFAGGASHPPSTVGKSQQEQITATLRTALTANSTITRDGTDSVGDHYKVVVQPRQLIQAILTQVAASGPAAAALGQAGASVNKVSNKPVTVDAWSSGGKLVRIDLDARQFRSAPGGPTHPVGIRFDFGSESGSITTPSSATPVDLAKLATLFGGLAGTGFGGPPAKSTSPTAKTTPTTPNPTTTAVTLVPTTLKK